MSDARPRIRCAQFAPALADVPANLERMLRIVRAAEKDGVDLVVFPELALTGYALRDLFTECSLSLDSPEIRALRDASAGVSIAFGFVEETPQHLFFNSAAYAERGKLLHVHRKVQLPTYGPFEEGRHFAAGESVRAFDTRFGRLAMLVCEDAWHLPLPYLAAMDGAAGLLLLVASPTRGVGEGGKAKNTESWERLLQTYASALKVFVVFANRTGFDDGMGFWGGSRLVTPAGDIAALGAYHGEDFPTAEIDLDQVRQERIQNPMHRDERLPLVIAELERLLRIRRGDGDGA
jgi:predicted amidohydrolase